MLALTHYQWMGLGGMLLGLLILLDFRGIAKFYVGLRRAEAGVVQRVTPKRGREIVSIWTRVGTGDDLRARFARSCVTLIVGLVVFLLGLMALLGAWNGGP